MADLEHYFALVRKHPEMFANPEGAEITVLLDEQEIREIEGLAHQYYQAHGLPTAWGDVGVVYQDNYLLVLRDAVRFADGKRWTYFRLVDDDSAQGVITLPVYQGQVLLTKHFRHATRKWHIEVPRGFGESGQSNEENARRELMEETGATITKVLSLGFAYPNTGGTSEYNEFFYVEISAYGVADLHEGISELLVVSIAEFENMLRDGTIDDEFTIVAYTRAKLRGLL